MAGGYLDIAVTPTVAAAQEANGSRRAFLGFEGHREFRGLTPNEVDFIAARDTFYMATVSETGWPYVQHRGGPAGFLRVIDEKTLAFADFRGNRQYISLGNLATNDRAALILMDYPHRRRLKIYVRVEEKDASQDPALAQHLLRSDYKALVERAFLLHVKAFDWNCPLHITPRFTAAEVETGLSPIRARLEALEAENERLRRSAAEKM